MTSKIVVNNIEADAGVSTVTFGSEISASKIVTSSTSTFTNGLNVTGGSVGIGTDNPTKLLQVYNASSNPQVNIKSATGGTCELQFGDNADEVRGNIVYNCTDDYLSLHGYNNSERLRINSSGNVGIGTDNPAGKLEVYSGAGLASLVIQTPATSDAELEFRNTNGGNATWSIGLDYDDSKKFKIAYASANGASLTANELIGISTSGNIELQSGAGIDFSATTNGSGSAGSEVLDDYEEGTWTPDLRFGGSNTGISYSWRNGHYTKIGNQVTVRCAFGLTSKGTFSATNRAEIYGIPYRLYPYDLSGGFNYSFVGSYSGGVHGIHVIEHQYNTATADRLPLSRITAIDTAFSEMQYQHVGGTQRIAFVTTYFTDVNT